MAIAFVVSTEFFTSMISELGNLPSFSVLAAPDSRKVQSILENRQFRGQDRTTSCTFLLLLAAQHGL